MDELSFVEARAWSRHVFGTYLVDDSRWGAGGLFLGVAVGSRADAVEWGRGVASTRANTDTATDLAPKKQRTEHASTSGVCNNGSVRRALPTPSPDPKPNPDPSRTEPPL